MVSQNVTRQWDSVYEKKKKKSRVSSTWANIDACIPTVQRRKRPKKGAAKTIMLPKKKKKKKKKANHSSGCWYPHPCPLHCLLLEPVKKNKK
jgi:hypothetical protein